MSITGMRGAGLAACVLLAGALFVQTAGPARAASAEDLIEEAKKLYVGGRVEESAARYGAALASAQKAGNLELEERAARGLDELFGGGGGGDVIAARITVGGPGLTPDQRDLLVLVLGQLDGKRNGAFVSAPVIARRLLFAATELGDFANAAVAGDALRANAAKSGRASGVLATYADALVALDGGDADGALAGFTDVLETALTERWADVAAHASAEIAGIQHARGDAEAARAALQSVADTLRGEIGAQTTAAWGRAVRGRIEDPGAELLKPLAGAADGAGPAVAVPQISDGGYGKARSTELGRALKRFSKRKPLVTAQCGPNGFAFERHFEPETEEVKLFRPNEQRVDYGGLLVATRGRTVGLLAAKTENEGASGIRGVTASVGAPTAIGPVVRADYLLAQGETWSVTKAGVVTIEDE